MSSNTTPQKIDASVIDFCKSIAPSSKPEYVKFSPESWCKENECYDNVTKKVKTNGGKRQLGWRIQVPPNPLPKFMIEAIHHAIWVMENGDKLDITPQSDSAESIVFLEDHVTEFNEYRIGNRYRALVKDPYVTKYLQLCTFESSEYVSKTKLNELPAIPKELLNEQVELFEKILANCLSIPLPTSDFGAPIRACNKESHIRENRKKVGRNDPCPCGSGKKYKKCCIDKSL